MIDHALTLFPCCFLAIYWASLRFNLHIFCLSFHAPILFPGNTRAGTRAAPQSGSVSVAIMHVCAADFHMHPGDRKSWILHECKPRACPSAREDLCSRVTWDSADLEPSGAECEHGKGVCAPTLRWWRGGIWNARKRFLFWVKTNPTILGRKHKSDFAGGGSAQKSPLILPAASGKRKVHFHLFICAAAKYIKASERVSMATRIISNDTSCSRAYFEVRNNIRSARVTDKELIYVFSAGK